MLHFASWLLQSNSLGQVVAKYYKQVNTTDCRAGCIPPQIVVSSMTPKSTGMEEEKAIYLVLVEGEPVAFRRGFESNKHHSNPELESKSEKIHAESLVQFHDQLLEKTLDPGTYNKLYSFHHLANGFVIHTTHSQANKLSSAHGVVHLEKDQGVKLMTTYSPHLLNLPQKVWNQSGGEKHAGEGIVIGVVDTGIDPMHPSFSFDPSTMVRDTRFEASGSCPVGPRFPVGSCNGKIVSARYYVAGASEVYPLDVSDLSPYDEVGHGSHVAAIAAGNWGVPVVVDGFNYGRASGMAPRARLAIYKAIYPEGGTMADVISAIDQAARDKVDVIVLSIGPDETPKDSVTFINIFDIFLLFARRAGIFVVQAAGNKGPGESTVISYGPWVMGVASGTTGRTYTSTLVLGDGHQLQGVGLSAPTAGNGQHQLKLVSARDAAIFNNSSVSEECQHPEALQPAAVNGSIVICYFAEGFRSGTSTLAALLDTARIRGFSGFVLAAHPLYGDLIAQPLPFLIPGILIPYVKDSHILFQYYENNTQRNPNSSLTNYKATAAIKEGRLAAFDEPVPIVARSSSRGPDIIDNKLNPADVLKPDILAPGNQIWSAWSPISSQEPILSGRNFALLSGTSMATPHVAGIAALIKQFHPSWTPSMIASALSTTAMKHDSRGLPIMAQGAELHSLYASTPFDHGAGFVNAAGALDPGLVLSADFEDYISFLCSFPSLDRARVKFVTGVACNATLPSPADLNLPSITISALVGSRSVHRTVKNVASKPERYTCSVLPPDGITVDVLPPSFSLLPQRMQDLVVRFNVTRVSDNFKFGEIVLTGSLNHIVRLPLSIFPKAVA